MIQFLLAGIGLFCRQGADSVHNVSERIPAEDFSDGIEGGGLYVDPVVVEVIPELVGLCEEVVVHPADAQLLFPGEVGQDLLGVLAAQVGRGLSELVEDDLGVVGMMAVLVHGQGLAVDPQAVGIGDVRADAVREREGRDSAGRLVVVMDAQFAARVIVVEVVDLGDQGIVNRHHLMGVA